MRKKVIAAATAAWLLTTLTPAVAAPAVQDSAIMQTLPGLVEVEGSSVNLVATDDRATIRVDTSGLTPGNVYTLWGFSFSYPGNCEEGVAASMTQRNVPPRSDSRFNKSQVT